MARRAMLSGIIMKPTRYIFAFLTLLILAGFYNAAFGAETEKTGSAIPDWSRVLIRIGVFNEKALNTDKDSGWYRIQDLRIMDIQQGKNIWVKILLPPDKWKDPVLYLNGNFNDLEIFLDTNKLLDCRGVKYRAKHRSIDIIPLKGDYAAHPVYLKARIPNSFFLGELREIRTGSLQELLSRKAETEGAVLLNAIFDSAISGILLFLSAFTLFLYISRYSLRLYPFLVFSVVAVCSSVDNLVLPLSLAGFPGLEYGYLDLINVIALLILAPVFIYFIELMFGKGWKNIIRRFWQLTAIYSLIFGSAILYDFRYYTYFPNINLYLIVVIALIAIAFIISGYQKEKSARPLVYAIGVFMILALFDLIRSETATGSDFSLSGIGVLCLAFSLTHLMMSYYSKALDESAIAQDKVKKKELELEVLKEETLRSQYEALKNQVNPHFLFNTFSTLISLIEEDPTHAAEFVQKLSNVYRYVLLCQDKQLMPIAAELEFTKSFAYLLTKRFDQGFNISINVPEHLHEHYVVPLSLQMLIENVIKHNVVSSKRQLSIEIYADVDNNYLIVRNMLQKKSMIENSTKLGLKNIVKRYGFFTGKEVRIAEEAGYFTVSLPILEREHEYKSDNH